MLNRETVEKIILNALNNINDERGPDEQLTVDLDTRLFGTGAVLDSLSLVSVIVDVEQAISAAADIEINLTNDRAMSQAESPFSNVNALSAYILQLLSESA